MPLFGRQRTPPETPQPVLPPDYSLETRRLLDQLENVRKRLTRATEQGGSRDDQR